MLVRSLKSLLLALAWVALLVPPATADVVGPDAEDCVEGTSGRSCHGGPYCRPDRCLVSADCSGGETCQELGLCVGKVGCAGMLDPGEDPADYERDDITGRCTPGETGACSTCQTIKVCAGPGAQAGGSDDGGCRGVAAGGASLLSLALLFGLAHWRRRRPLT